MKGWQKGMFSEVFIIVVALLVGCGSEAETSPTLTPLPTLEARPNYILDVIPRESTAIWIKMYQMQTHSCEARFPVFETGPLNSRVCVVLNIAEIRDQLLPSYSAASATNLIIDGVPQQSLSILELNYFTVEDYCDSIGADQHNPTQCNIRAICWPADLDSGTHQARIDLVKDSSSVSSYGWQFALVEEQPPIELPGWINIVEPKPETIFSSEDEVELVCIDINPSTISDLLPAEGAQLRNLTASIGHESLSDPIDSGRLSSSSLRRCWQDVMVFPGSNRVSLRLTNEEGDKQLEYKWRFIVDKGRSPLGCTNWQLENVVTNGEVRSDLVFGQTINFGFSYSVSGDDGCNELSFGIYTATDDGQFSVGRFATTGLACGVMDLETGEETSIMDAVDEYLLALHNSVAYEIKDGRLRLYYPENKSNALVFQRR